MTARPLALLLFFALLLLYTAALCPGAYWLDSSEFAAASFLLGVAHPPGHPLTLLLGKAATLLPIGSVALRVGFTQALCGAAAGALLLVYAARLADALATALGRAPDEAARRRHLLMGAGVAIATSLGYAAAFQAVRPEVYATQRLLSVLVLGLLLDFARGGDLRRLLLAALCMSLGLANHHYLMLILMLPALLLLPRQRLARTLGLGVLVGLAGLLLYLYLPLRGARHPLVNWGAPVTLSRVLWVMSAAPFQKSFQRPRAGDEDALGAVVDAAHPLGVLLALIGLYLLVRQGATRRYGLYLLLVIGLGVGGRMVTGFDVANPDAYGYMVTSIDALALCAAAAVAALGLLLPRRLPWLLALGAGGAAALWGALSFPRSDRSGFFELNRHAGALLAEAPPRARLISTYFESLFALWYLQGVEGQRPDVQHLHPHFLSYPGFRDDLLRRYPEDPLLPRILGDKGLQVTPLLQALRAPGARPTLLEYDLEVPDALLPHLSLLGPLERVNPEPRALGAAAGVDPGEVRDPQSLRYLFWHSYLRMTLACRRGDGPAFNAEVARSERFLRGGRSPEVEELKARCAR